MPYWTRSVCDVTSNVCGWVGALEWLVISSARWTVELMSFINAVSLAVTLPKGAAAECAKCVRNLVRYMLQNREHAKPPRGCISGQLCIW